MGNLRLITVNNFRNHKEFVLEAEEGVTVILGKNGAGKTNLLEAIHMLSVGRSFRADKGEEVIAYGQGLARIKAEIDGGNLEIVVSDGTLAQTKRKFSVNGVARRMIDFVGNLRAVLFGPWDMELLDGSPGKRRNYLDMVLSQVDREYYRCLLSYEKGVRQRNKLLGMIAENRALRGQLMFWDKLLIKNGNYLTDKRELYVEYLNASSDGERLQVGYDRSTISEARLEQYANEEVLAGVTLVGPHRDDFSVFRDKKDVAKYGSRGEQRMAVLWLKMGELKFIELRSQVRPLLLLDDIFSELDSIHRGHVMSMMEKGQVIITAADPHLINGIAGRVIKLGGDI